MCVCVVCVCGGGSSTSPCSVACWRYGTVCVCGVCVVCVGGGQLNEPLQRAGALIYASERDPALAEQVRRGPAAAVAGRRRRPWVARRDAQKGLAS